MDGHFLCDLPENWQGKRDAVWRKLAEEMQQDDAYVIVQSSV